MTPENRGNYPVPTPQPEPDPAPRPNQPPASQAYMPYQGQLPAQNSYPRFGQPQPAAKKAKTGLFLWGGLVAGLVALAIVAVLVVIPLFNRSSRTEADPFAVSRNAQAAPAGGSAVKTSPTVASFNSTTGSTMGNMTAPATTGLVPANEATTTIVSKGDFTKIDAIHYARGTAIVGIGSDGKKVLRFENFTSAQGPDLKVYLGKHADGSQVEENGVNLGPLPATDGSYNIALPDDLDLSQYRSVVIWCEAFSVTFSVASLA